MELTQILLTYGPLGEDCLADLNRVAKVARFNAGDYLIRQGEECKSFYFVRDGILRVCHQTEKKRTRCCSVRTVTFIPPCNAG